MAQASLIYLNGDLSEKEETELSEMSDEEHVSTRIGSSEFIQVELIYFYLFCRQ